MTSTAIRDLMIEVVNDTCKYYAEDFSNRHAYDQVSGVCQYLTEDGRKCAVGRLLDIPSEHPAWTSLAGSSGLFNYYGKKILPERLRAIPINFWGRLQIMHDDSYNVEELKWEAARIIEAVERGDHD